MRELCSRSYATQLEGTEHFHVGRVPKLPDLWSFSTLSLFTIKQLRVRGQEEEKTDFYLVRKEVGGLEEWEWVKS